jgi:hypothetical protein
LAKTNTSNHHESPAAQGFQNSSQATIWLMGVQARVIFRLSAFGRFAITIALKKAKQSTGEKAKKARENTPDRGTLGSLSP